MTATVNVASGVSQTIKALTLWQPWASLIASGHKRIETRGWPTRYRGLLAIHAAKRAPRPADLAIADGVPLPDPLPLGAVVCLVRLVDVVPSEALLARPGFDISPERIYGNYQPGRFGWILELVEVFNPAIPAKGAQGLWSWTRPGALQQSAAPATVNTACGAVASGAAASAAASAPAEGAPESLVERDGDDRAPVPRLPSGNMAEREKGVSTGQYWFGAATRHALGVVARRFIDEAEQRGGVIVGRIAYLGGSGQWVGCVSVRASRETQRELLQVYLRGIGVSSEWGEVPE